MGPNTRGGRKGADTIKGYFTPSGYMGLVGDRYMLFATDSDYYDYMTQ